MPPEVREYLKKPDKYGAEGSNYCPDYFTPTIIGNGPRFNVYCVQ